MATIGPTGAPHVVAMWYGVLDGQIWFETKAKSQKAQNLRRDDRMTVLIEDGLTYDTLRGVSLEGRGVIVDDPDVLWQVGLSVWERYTGPYTEEQRPLWNECCTTGSRAARRRAGPLVGPPQARAAAHAGGRHDGAVGGLTDGEARVSYADYQHEIYLRGTAGERPPFTTDLSRLEEAAREVLDPQAFGYVAGSAGSGSTARANRAAFERWRIVPRMLRDVAERDLSTEVLGTPMPAPVLLAPIGVQTIVHPEGELASARAAAELGLVYIHSTAAAHSIEQAAEASGDGPRWYQLYWPKDPEVAASLVQRAEAAGYRAIVVTLDTFMLGWRPTDLDTAYLPFLQGTGIANYLTDGVQHAARRARRWRQVFRWAGMFGNPRLTPGRPGWL